MVHLCLSLFGSFQATLDDTPLLDFESNKVRALLAFLVTEGTRPHHRIEVATLLWPQMDDAGSLRNLRHAIANLRRCLGDTRARVPFLLVDRYTLQVNPDANLTVDVLQFRCLLARAQLATSEQEALCLWRDALALYRGEYLQGFRVRGSVPWEEWLLLRRKEFEHSMVQILDNLARAYERRGEYRRASEYVQQWIRHAPWNEEAHHQLIRLLALDGQRSAALAQFETCRALLRSELGVDPTPETVALVNAIRKGDFPSPSSFVVSSRRVSPSTRVTLSQPHFVAREREMARLDEFLRAAFSGQPQFAFITGEAGSGKSALAAAFGQRVLREREDTIVVRGESNALAGQGDPFLPFRDILLALIGVPEALHLGSEMGDMYARRIQRLASITIPLLVETAPDLVGGLGLTSVLTMQVEAFLPQSARKRALLQTLREYAYRTADMTARLSQSYGFSQFTHLLARLSEYVPLVLMLDDLQWADAGSLSLLFHLVRRLRDSRILLLGMFRSEEVLLPKKEGRSQERSHPLSLIVYELQRRWGEVLIDLDKSPGREFVDAYLDTEPNRLGEEFRERVWRYTGGNALFTVELLRALQERGDLFRDAEGRWRSRAELGWKELPARVEAVIAERIARLPAQWRQLLSVASVLGETFSAEVLADVLAWPLPEMRRALATLASPPRRLVQFRGHAWVEKKMLSTYRFRHNLFRTYLYDQITEAEKVVWHRKIAVALEEVYQDHPERVALEVGRHFESARMPLEAARYYRLAGRRAMRLFAPSEAMALYGHGLALLQDIPESPEQAEEEMMLQMAMSTSLLAMQGWGAPERAQASQRAYDLARRMGDAHVLVQVLFVQADMLRARGEHVLSLQLGEQLLKLAKQEGTESALALAHWTLGETYFFLGELAAARHHLARALEHYPPNERALTPLTAVDLRVVCHVWLAWVEALTGHPDRGKSHVQAALDLAHEIDHPLSLIFALTLGAYGFYWLCHQPEEAAHYEAELMPLMDQDTLASVHPWGHVFLGWARAARGQLDAGIEEMEAGFAAWKEMGAVSGLTCQAIPLIEAYIRAGRTDAARALVDESLLLAEQTEERVFWQHLLGLRQQVIA